MFNVNASPGNKSGPPQHEMHIFQVRLREAVLRYCICCDGFILFLLFLFQCVSAPAHEIVDALTEIQADSEDDVHMPEQYAEYVCVWNLLLWTLQCGWRERTKRLIENILRYPDPFWIIRRHRTSCAHLRNENLFELNLSYQIIHYEMMLKWVLTLIIFTYINKNI